MPLRQSPAPGRLARVEAGGRDSHVVGWKKGLCQGELRRALRSTSLKLLASLVGVNDGFVARAPSRTAPGEARTGRMGDDSRLLHGDNASYSVAEGGTLASLMLACAFMPRAYQRYALSLDSGVWPFDFQAEWS